MDDVCALAMVLNWPQAELLAITTVAEHQGKRAGYARYALALAGREDIPVAAGADASLDCYRSWPGLPDEDAYWPEPIPPIPTSFEDTINFQHDPLTCAIALGWNEGVEIREIPLKSEIQDSWLWQRVDHGGEPTRVVMRVNGDKFNKFWLDTVLRQNRAAPAVDR
jgi:inosine-uridine nucleoside N-ribohydrolase